MPNDLPLLPPKNQQKHLDKSMISLPSDFRHLAHVSPLGITEIENLRKSDNVIDTVNEVNYYIKPSSSSNSTLRSQKKERFGLDDAFPSTTPTSEDVEHVRGYENQPTTHQYINIAPPRPSRKNYRAPAPPTPPSQDSKPNLVYDAYETPGVVTVDPPVVFRSISKEPTLSDNIPSPKIHTPKRIEAPKPNSVVIERPGDLGAFSFGLDDCIPIVKNTSPLKTLSPLHRPLVIQKSQPTETPILSPGSPPQDGMYMSTIRSTSAQGKKILDELDDWLDDLDDDDREKLSTISTDESGYPTLAHEKDRVFMKHLVEKYELGVEPETVRLRKKKAPAPRLPPEALSSPTIQAPPSIPPFSASRPVSMPPNRPPPSYDAPSFDAPVYEGGLINGRALTKQNALDLRSSEEGVSPAMARFLFDKRIKSATMPMSVGRTTSSGFTDVSTTSSRSDAASSILSAVDEDPIEILKKSEEFDEQSPPVPKPRTRKTVSTEPTLIDEENVVVVGGVGDAEIRKENVIGEEFEVIETTTKMDLELKKEREERKEKEIETIQEEEEEEKIDSAPVIIFKPLPPPFPTPYADSSDSNSGSEDDENDLIVTRF
ncbi:hypothetical protein CAEBREN_30261 [Caenorhabditis brenneri]|uniref:CRIB domain-containing protein n=1 Tax=Caenorhabditis brenneri TaxID=135651 RepID=G0MPL0_CAEBE|nr:hypothetical protein CAEBREN_30261 [Caenorhabditis brenneri]